MSAKPTPPTPPIPPLFARRHIVLYLLVLAGILAAFVAVTRIYRQKIDEYQYSRERYAAERALDALAKGDTAKALNEIKALEREAPIGVTQGLFFTRKFSEVTEGPVLRNRVTLYENLMAELMRVGQLAAAESIGWKSMMEFHIVSRTVEMLIPWNLMLHLKAARRDWNGAFGCSQILAAHGMQAIEPLNKLDPIPYPIPEAMVAGLDTTLPQTLHHGLQVADQASNSYEQSNAVDALQQARTTTTEPIIRHRIEDRLHRALIQAERKSEARTLLNEIWGRDAILMDPFWRDWPARMPRMNILDRDPTLMEFLWRDRPATATLTLAGFVDSFKLDSRVQVSDLRGLEQKQTGYFQPANQFMFSGDHVLFFQNVGAAMNFTTLQPVRKVYFAYSATLALGVYPILLVRFDTGPYIPVYCDSETPELVGLEINLGPGRHRVEMLYLNDASFAWPSRNIKEDRNLSLYRMALVHVQGRR